MTSAEEQSDVKSSEKPNEQPEAMDTVEPPPPAPGQPDEEQEEVGPIAAEDY